MSCHEKYVSGQIWSYKDSLNDRKIIILKVEYINREKIIHVGIKNGQNYSPSHMPFSEGSIDASVDELISDNELIPNYKEGYNYWKNLYVKEEAGIYSITVHEALALI